MIDVDTSPLFDWIPPSHDRTLALLIRHSIRHDPIPRGVHHQDIHLTPEGRETAFAFGRSLPSVDVVKLFYSPIYRCHETAEYIQNGVQSRGGATVWMGERRFLGSHYIVDLNQMVRLLETHGRSGFARHWLNGDLEPDIIDDPYQLAGDLVQGVSAALTDTSVSTIAVFVTHDLNILAVRDLYLQVRHEAVGWPTYLDGVIFTRHNADLILRWRDRTHTFSTARSS